MPKPGKELRARDAKCDLGQELLQSILEMKAGRRGRLHKVTRKAVEQVDKVTTIPREHIGQVVGEISAVQIRAINSSLQLWLALE